MNPRRQKLVEAYYKNKIPHIEICVENFENLHDISAIARSADGFGVSKIHLYYSEYPYPDITVHGKKSSASANKWILYEHIENIKAFYQQKKEQGYSFVSISEKTTDSKPLNNYTFQPKTLLVVGSPQLELNKELSAFCDDFIYPPMLDKAEYSTSNCVAMTLYEVFSQLGHNLVPIHELIPRGKRD